MFWILAIRYLLLVLLLASCAPVQHYPEAVFPDLGKPWGEDRIPALPELTRADKMMNLHALAMALTTEDPISRFIWTNPDTGNGGEIIILGVITHGPYVGCLGLQVGVLVQGRDIYRENPAACRGGGNSNTWIVNRKYVISSVDRRYFGGCIRRFMDAKLARGRVSSTETICQVGPNWVVGG